MTIHEVSQKYKIPVEILRKYECWGLCESVKKVMGDWHYDDRDLEHLSLIVTLYDTGFTSEEVETYMRLLSEGASTESKRLGMLNQKRNQTLDEIHFKEKQMSHLDYLRYKIRKNQREETDK